MKTIKLEDGQEIKISEESYKALQEAAQKDWRDAFVEKGIISKEQKVTYSMAHCIKTNEFHICTEYKAVCAYVSKFKSGGFWIHDGDVFFVTNGVRSDSEATYTHAKTFLEEFK